MSSRASWTNNVRPSDEVHLRELAREVRDVLAQFDAVSGDGELRTVVQERTQLLQQASDELFAMTAQLAVIAVREGIDFSDLVEWSGAAPYELLAAVEEIQAIDAEHQGRC